jgi:hypothetical protein
MLDDAHEQSSRDPGKERGEQNPPDHVFSPLLVAGKADGVPGVVGGVVQTAILGEAHAVKQD